MCSWGVREAPIGPQVVRSLARSPASGLPLC